VRLKPDAHGLRLKRRDTCDNCVSTVSVFTRKASAKAQIIGRDDKTMLSQDNTKRRDGRAGGPCCKMKNMNCPPLPAAQKGGPAGCTAGRASGLHIKLGYGKGRAGGLLFSAARWTALLFSPPKIHVFHLEIRPSSPPGPPALLLVLSLSSGLPDWLFDAKCHKFGFF